MTQQSSKPIHPKPNTIASGASFAALALCLLALVACSPRKSYSFPAEETPILAEKEALDATCKAVSRFDRNSDQWEPYAYDRTNFLARNIYNHNDGWVLWHRVGSTNAFDLKVDIEKRRGRILCQVSLPE